MEGAIKMVKQETTRSILVDKGQYYEIVIETGHRRIVVARCPHRRTDGGTGVSDKERAELIQHALVAIAHELVK